jgi:hypothetical protein
VFRSGCSVSRQSMFGPSTGSNTRLEHAIQDSKDSAACLKAHREEHNQTLQDLHVSTPPISPDNTAGIAPHNTDSILAALTKSMELNTLPSNALTNPGHGKKRYNHLIVKCGDWATWMS